MTCTAILVGNTDYRNLPKLDCCRDDVLAMKQLLAATDKYEQITVIENADADDLKSQLRGAIDLVRSPQELFFYFTGHGFHREGELFHCANNFDSTRPNETGISTTELHTLLRLADAELVVKVIDSCHSGTLLVKSDTRWIQRAKDGFRNLIHIASCLDSQNSFTGKPLSVFTEKFRDAALRKHEGVVFYTDIISTLRDEFIDNDLQTPFFVSQQTGREQFVGDAKRLDGLRKTLEESRAEPTARAEIAQSPVTPPMTLLDRLRVADEQVIKPELMASFVGTFFDNLIKKVSASTFADFFDVEITEHERFEEDTTEKFIISALSGEKRPDNFVTAHYSRKMRKQNPIFGTALLNPFLDDNMYVETWDLRLNCTMARAQLRITFTPKFTNLQRIILVATCAPSLDFCYIFEIVTQHQLRDFGKFDPDGPELSRLWWKFGWSKATDEVAELIANKLTQTARNQLESAEARLSKGV